MLERPPRSQNRNATEEMAPQTPEWADNFTLREFAQAHCLSPTAGLVAAAAAAGVADAGSDRCDVRGSRRASGAGQSEHHPVGQRSDSVT